MVQGSDGAITEIALTDEDMREVARLIKEKQVLRAMQHLLAFADKDGAPSIPS